MTTYKCNGHIPDSKDKVYIPFEKSKIMGVSTPTSNDVDLRPFSKNRHDQGQTESCVANSTTKAIMIKNAQKYGVENTIDLSRLDLYYGARLETNPPTNHLDQGTYINLAMDVLRRFGVAREVTWPFDPSKINTIPSIMTTREGYLNKIDAHYKIDSTGNNLIDDIVLNLKNGNPVVFGMQVGQEFQNYNANSDPLNNCTNIIGSHATVLIGWINGILIGENSWGGISSGSTWGKDGFYFIDPSVISNPNIATDFWVMENSIDVFWENKNQGTNS
jgi:C1A family cysteine protease